MNPRNWTELAVHYMAEARELRQPLADSVVGFIAGRSRDGVIHDRYVAAERLRSADESERAARAAASQARAHVPWPGETIATLFVVDVMAEAETVEAGRCC